MLPALPVVGSHCLGDDFAGDVVGNAAALDKLREQYAMTPNALPAALDRQSLTGFFFWTSWAAAANRPQASASLLGSSAESLA